MIRSLLAFGVVFLLVQAAVAGRISAFALAALGSALHSHAWGDREVRFVPQSSQTDAALRIEIARRSTMQWDGSGPIRIVNLDPARFWGTPLALYLGLCAGSVVLGRARWCRIAGGLAALQAALAILLGLVLLNESRALGLAAWIPLNSAALDHAQNVLVNQLAFAAPVALWWAFLGVPIARPAADAPPLAHPTPTKRVKH
jgi:hypothetical protein